MKQEASEVPHDASLHLPARDGHRPGTRFRAELSEGLAVFFQRRWLRVLAAMSAVSYGCWSAAVTVLGPVYARQHLHGPVGWGIVTSALGLGLACGSLISLLARPRRIGLIMCGSTGFSAMFMASMASGAPLPAVAAAAMTTGAAGTVQGITWTAFLQSVIPAGQFARVTSLYALATSALVPLAYLAAGPVADLTRPRPAMWGCTAVEALAGLAAIAIPDVRRLIVSGPGPHGHGSLRSLVTWEEDHRYLGVPVSAIKPRTASRLPDFSGGPDAGRPRHGRRWNLSSCWTSSPIG